MEKRLPSLSKFAQALTSSPILPYQKKVIQYSPEQYDELERPEGKILLCVAENKLQAPALLEKIQRILSEQPIPPAVLNYTSGAGLPSLRKRLAIFFAQRLFRHNPTINVDPDHLFVGAGCVAMLTSLSLLLLEEGDGILIPAPYYPAFDHDFFNFAHATVCPIHGTPTDDPQQPFGVLTEEALELAYKAAQMKGHRPRAILLSNPNNPLGTLYSVTELRAVLSFVEQHSELHLIMDEIYALSVFPPHHHPIQSIQSTPFSEIQAKAEAESSESSHSESVFGLSLSLSSLRYVSVVELLGEQGQGQGRGQQGLGDRVHMVWSFSKDFGASGLRVGVLYSQNADLLSGMYACNEPMMASNLTQHCLAQLLADDAFVSSYLRANREALYSSYLYLADALQSLHIPVLPAQGGIFLFADFRHYLSSSTFEEELALFEWMAEEGGVIFTPGESCHCPAPGFFRVCYAFVPLAALSVAMQRLKRCLQTWQEQKEDRREEGMQRDLR